MESIQKGYIFLLGPLGRINTDRNRGLRYFIIGVCFFLIFLIAYLHEVSGSFLHDDSILFIDFFRDIYALSYFTRSIIIGCLLTIALMLGVEKDLPYKPWNFYIAIIWITMNVLCIIAGTFHDIGEGYLVAQVFIFILIPAFYIVYGCNGRLKDLYDAIAISMVIFTVIYSLVSIVWFPYGEITIKAITEQGETIDQVATTIFNEGRYMGIMPHPSRIAHFATLSAATSLYVIYRKDNWISIMAAIALGSATMFSVMSISRTSVASIALCITCFIIICLKQRRAKKILVAAALVMLSFFISYNLINNGLDNMNLFSHHLNAEVSYAEDGSESAEEGETSVWMNRFNSRGTLNRLTSGRIGIWNVFIDNLNMVGHDARYSYPLKVRDPDTGALYYFSYPHNYALDSAYRAGIPVGVLIIALELAMAMFAIMALLKKRNNFKDEYVMTVLVIAFFALTGNFESVDHVFTRIAILFFYFGFIPVFGLSRGKERADDK